MLRNVAFLRRFLNELCNAQAQPISKRRNHRWTQMDSDRKKRGVAERRYAPQAALRPPLAGRFVRPNCGSVVRPARFALRSTEEKAFNKKK